MRDDKEPTPETGSEVRGGPNVKARIEITPGVCGGKPRIAGHRIRVMDIAIWHEQGGWSPDEIIVHFPQLTLADVYAALTYYRGHQGEIEADIRCAKEIEAEARARHPSRLKASSRPDHLLRSRYS